MTSEQTKALLADMTYGSEPEASWSISGRTATRRMVQNSGWSRMQPVQL